MTNKSDVKSPWITVKFEPSFNVMYVNNIGIPLWYDGVSWSPYSPDRKITITEPEK